MRAKYQAKGGNVDKAENPVAFRDKVHCHDDHTSNTEKTNQVEQPELPQNGRDLLEEVPMEARYRRPSDQELRSETDLIEGGKLTKLLPL